MHVYTKDESGLVKYKGVEQYSTIEQKATAEVDGLIQDAHESAGLAWIPEFDHEAELIGWPHSLVKWYRPNGLGGEGYIGIGIATA